jgi:hypothetical protein
MRINGHYDQPADIAWLRFEDYDASTVVAEETGFGLRELDPAVRHVVGLKYWQASRTLPDDLMRMLPAPPVGVAPQRPRCGALALGWRAIHVDE